VLLDAVPDGLDVEHLRTAILALPGVDDVHHLHVWSMGPSQPALSAHVAVDGTSSVHDAQEHVRAVRELMHQRYGIDHVTVEVECHPCFEPDHVDEPDAHAGHSHHMH
jgi:cobalt-zinc-cadmium efflux system protein